MLNGHDVLVKGERLITQGLRRDLMETSAAAFAMSSQASKRDEQLAANKDLQAQFPKLAPVKGNELFLTVGCSRTTAYLRALQCGAVENVGGSHTQPGHAVHDCIHSGWRWLMLSDILEASFPALPLLYSSALNNNNAVHVASTEVECLATLSRFLRLGKTLSQAVEGCKEGEPSCKPYLDSIAYFAKSYTGGADMPLVDFLVSFSAFAFMRRRGYI